jgi:protein AFG1
LHIFDRSLRIPWCTKGACRFSFSELCEKDLGPADYLSIASTFRTLILTDVPILPTSAKNQARRFISLIDALYEARCQLICLAEDRFEDLFFPDAGSAAGSNDTRNMGEVSQRHEDVMMAESVSEMHGRYRPNISSYDLPRMEQAPAMSSTHLPLDQLSIFSGQDEQFAFKRALSRLHEMTSPSYARDETWVPLEKHARKWENTADRIPTQTLPARAPTLSGLDHPGLSRAGHSNISQPPAPKLSNNHIWGVREDWGPRAGKWGKGAGAYDEKDQRRS